MDTLKRILMAALMCCVVSAGAFAQRRPQDPKDPPPKSGDQPKVKVQPKDPPPDRREPRGNGNKRP